MWHMPPQNHMKHASKMCGTCLKMCGTCPNLFGLSPKMFSMCQKCRFRIFRGTCRTILGARTKYVQTRAEHFGACAEEFGNCASHFEACATQFCGRFESPIDGVGLSVVKTSLSLRQVWVRFPAWLNRTQCRQRLATAITFPSGAKPRKGLHL